MHYKNGKPASEGDPIIYRQHWDQKVIAGTIHSLNPSSTCCNGIIAAPVMGGCATVSVVVGDCYHAADALAAIEAQTAKVSANPPKSS